MTKNFQKYYSTLELDKVLDMLANEISLADAANLAKTLKPNFNQNNVIKSLEQTYAAYKMLGISVMPSFLVSGNCVEPLKRAVLGAVLNPMELLRIAETLRVIRRIKVWRENVKINEKTCLDGYFNNLIPNKFFEDTVFSCINNDESINDNASPELFNIRRKITVASNNIREKLDKIVHGNQSKFLQESIITQRDGRFVVPVKSEHRANLPGIVHDTSASGATLFVEPMAVVEINNDIRVLMAKEREEIERILTDLSLKAASFADSIINSYNLIVKLALIFGKASLAYKMNAVLPNINTNGRVVLNKARHPLLNPKTVVPISLTLGKTYNSLIITGPNTGGKTVTLKTIGLLTLMAMCGLMVPADSGTEIAVFDKILVDIGDEQSIEQSLSTFSSHMVNIISIINSATPDSLVLIDELGSGTDPIEGAALAKSILIYLANKTCKTVATTHYAELKTYALETDGVENASCEFDIEHLKPTYRLNIGVPGRSNAFAISEKLGLNNQIIKDAQGFINKRDVKFESIIEALEKERIKTAKKGLEIEEIKTALLKEKQELELKLNNAQKNYDAVLEKAKYDAMRIIDNTKQKSDNMLNELEEIKKQFTSQNASDKYKFAKSIVKNTINAMHDDANPVSKNLKGNYVLPRELVVGDNVKIIDISKNGTVEEVSLKNKKALIAAGNLKMWVSFENLMLLNNTPQKNQKGKTLTVPSKLERSATTELDLRGMASDEAIIELDRFINNAIMCNIGSFTIIHGKGTGVLRAAVHKYLKTNKYIKTFRLGLFGEGENGVTIAEIK